MDNPWKNLKKVNNEYIADCDKGEIQFFKNELQGEDYCLRLNLTPGPYMGDPKRAVLYLLNLNPGYSDKDAKICDENFGEIYKNLNHERVEYPFLALNQFNKESPGYEWWFQKLHWLIERTSIQTVANYLFVAEYFPYPSISYRHINRILPSQRYTFSLIREALKLNKIIIIMRGKTHWIRQIPELEEYNRQYQLHSPRNVSISPKNIGQKEFEDIVKELDKK